MLTALVVVIRSLALIGCGYRAVALEKPGAPPAVGGVQTHGPAPPGHRRCQIVRAIQQQASNDTLPHLRRPMFSDDTTALVPIDTWALQSPALR
jgi:hypothetical protein